MAYLTERKYSNTLDCPVNLPATEIKMGDWLVVATFKLVTPMKLTFKMLHLNFISSTFDITKLTAVNKINPGYGLCYVGLFLNYISGDPAAQAITDKLVATELGIVTRTGTPFVTVTPGTYSWVAVNNIAYNSNNALLGVTDSADFKLSVVGQFRVELDETL